MVLLVLLLLTCLFHQSGHSLSNQTGLLHTGGVCLLILQSLWSRHFRLCSTCSSACPVCHHLQLPSLLKCCSSYAD